MTDPSGPNVPAGSNEEDRSVTPCSIERDQLELLTGAICPVAHGLLAEWGTLVSCVVVSSRE